MEKHIYDEKNGLRYTLQGDYYLPDLALNEEEPTYGKYGMLRKQFLKEHRSAKYQYLLLTTVNFTDTVARYAFFSCGKTGSCLFLLFVKI